MKNAERTNKIIQVQQKKRRVSIQREITYIYPHMITPKSNAPFCTHSQNAVSRRRR